MDNKNKSKVNRKVDTKQESGKNIKEHFSAIRCKLSLFFKYLIVIIILTIVVISIWQLNIYITTSPYFALAEVELIGNKHLNQKKIMEIGDIFIGENIFKINIDNLEKRLLKNPWIKEVELTRRLPRYLKIKIVEKNPVAIVFDNLWYFVENDGSIIKDISPDEYQSLPFITGIKINKRRQNEEETLKIKEGLDIIKLLNNNSFETKHGFGELHYDDGNWILYSERPPIEINIGNYESIKQKLNKLNLVFNEIRKRRLEVKYIYFSKLDRVIVGLNDQVLGE